MRQPITFEITRHYRQLTEQETADLVDAIADMVVAFVKTRKIEPASKPEQGAAAGPAPAPNPERN